MSKALAYTTFALIASSLIFTLAAFPAVNPDEPVSVQAERIGEARFFLENTESDMERALRIATRRGLTSITNKVVNTGEPIKRPSENLTEVVVNGSFNGEELQGMENASIKDWEERVSDIASRSGYSIELQVRNLTVQQDSLELDSQFNVFSRLEDPVVRTAFNSTKNITADVSITEVEDSMLLLQSKGRYVNKYSRCGFDTPAEVLYTGSQYSGGPVHGYVEKMPSDPQSVSNISEKVLVVEDADGYSESDFDGYEGIVSAQESGYNDTVSNEYVFGTSSIAEISQNQSLILEESRVWRSGFREMFEEGCYVPDERGPGFLDRLSNNLTSEDSAGFATMIDVSELPDELQKDGSAVGYVYFNGTGYGGHEDIEGVTGSHPWFGLDSYHVSEWSLEELTE